MLVEGFNKFAEFVAGISGPCIWGFNGIKNELSTVDGFKTWVVKPLTAVGSTLDYLNNKGLYPRLDKIGNEATTLKVVIGGLAVFTQLPAVLQGLSKKAEDVSEDRYNVKISWTAREVLFDRISTVAGWLIAVNDALSLSKRWELFTISKNFDNRISWLVTFAGGFSGAQSLYKDSKVMWCTWDTTSISEKAYQALGISVSFTYVALSAVGGLGIGYKGEKAPEWLDKARFGFTVAGAVLPMAKKVAAYWGSPKPKAA